MHSTRSSWGSADMLTLVCTVVQYASDCARWSIVRLHVVLPQNKCAVIENPAKYEMGGVTRFLWVKNHSAAEILRELCTVYSLLQTYREQLAKN